MTRSDAQDLADLLANQIAAGSVRPAKIDVATGLTALGFDATPAERAGRWETRSRRAWNALAALAKQRTRRDHPGRSARSNDAGRTIARAGGDPTA